jgi:adenylate kinase family enzyme
MSELNKNMPRGIRFLGPAGSGKSYIAEELAKRINAHHVETVKYRIQAVDEMSIPHEKFTQNSMQEVNALWDMVETRMVELVEQAIAEDGRFFILASALSPTCEAAKRLEQSHDAVIFVETHQDVRHERIRQRGKGNDSLIKKQLEKTTEYDDVSVPNPRNSRVRDEQWADTLSCPKIFVDGEKPVDEIIEELMQKLPQLRELSRAKSLRDVQIMDIMPT